jgi:hypothetical protein
MWLVRRRPIRLGLLATAAVLGTLAITQLVSAQGLHQGGDASGTRRSSHGGGSPRSERPVPLGARHRAHQRRPASVAPHRAAPKRLPRGVSSERTASPARHREPGSSHEVPTVPVSPPTQAPTPSRPRPPAPSPPPAKPVEPAGSLLFRGASIADFAALQEAPEAITEVLDPLGSGETVFKITVQNDDVYPVTPTENPRAQALSPSIVEPGDEFWLKTKFLIPQNFPNVSSWLSLVSIYGPSYDGSSPWNIKIAGPKIEWQRNGTYDWDIPWSMPLERDRWITILSHERFATDGWVEMWVDGAPVVFPEGSTRIEMETMDASNDGGPNAAKIMQYREAGLFESASLYFGPLELGTTRAAVGG